MMRLIKGGKLGAREQQKLSSVAYKLVKDMVSDNADIASVEYDSYCYWDMTREYAEEHGFTVNELDEEVRRVLDAISGR